MGRFYHSVILFFCIFTLVSNSASSFMMEIALGEVLISFLTRLQIACAEGKEVTPQLVNLPLASGRVTSPLAAPCTCSTVSFKEHTSGIETYNNKSHKYFASWRLIQICTIITTFISPVYTKISCTIWKIVKINKFKYVKQALSKLGWAAVFQGKAQVDRLVYRMKDNFAEIPELVRQCWRRMAYFRLVWYVNVSDTQQHSYFNIT